MPSLQEDIPPPGYDEVIHSTCYPVLRSGSLDGDLENGTQGQTPQGQGDAARRHLKFVDFTPHLTGNASRRKSIAFETLLERANTWLQTNKDVDVITCETVTWLADEFPKLNYTDVATTTTKRQKLKKTYFMRGLRLWLVPVKADEEQPRDCTTLGVRDFLPDVTSFKNAENQDLRATVRRLNSQLWEAPVSGRVLTVESVMQPTRVDAGNDKVALKVKDTYWTDGGSCDRKYIPVIRIFYALGARNMNLEIGLTDIFPRTTKHHGRVRYEDMESLMFRASEWALNQPHVNIINMQSLLFRRRGFSQGVGHLVFWASQGSEESCVRCIRIAYTKPKTMVTLRVVRPNNFCIFKKTFAPQRSALAANDPEYDGPTPDDLKYEGFSKTVEQASLWISKLDARILCVETLRHQVERGRYHSNPESSVTRSSEDKSREMLSHIRIYLRGETGAAEIADSIPGRLNLRYNPFERPIWPRALSSALPRRGTDRCCRRAVVVAILSLVLLGIVAVVVAKFQNWF